jgi:bacteriochlorophyll 4-vinyl reductase
LRPIALQTRLSGRALKRQFVHSMTRTDPFPTGSPPAAPLRAERRNSITPIFPLLLLQTMRDMDRPEEILEDEDLTISLPRRFGLSDVVGRQIYRFQEEVRRRQPQSVADVEALIRLVGRRPDAEAIFREAGRRMANQAWGERAAGTRRALKWMPRALALLTGLRAARRLLRQLVGDGSLRIQRSPVEMLISASLTARADPTGRACAFYSGVFEELLHRYTGRAYRVLHDRCEALGNDSCEWSVRVG